MHHRAIIYPSGKMPPLAPYCSLDNRKPLLHTRLLTPEFLSIQITAQPLLARQQAHQRLKQSVCDRLVMSAIAPIQPRRRIAFRTDAPWRSSFILRHPKIFPCTDGCILHSYSFRNSSQTARLSARGTRLRTCAGAGLRRGPAPDFGSGRIETSQCGVAQTGTGTSSRAVRGSVPHLPSSITKPPPLFLNPRGSTACA